MDKQYDGQGWPATASFLPGCGFLCALLVSLLCLPGLSRGQGKKNSDAEADFFLQVKTIAIQGAEKTKQWVILRELTLQQGEEVAAQNLAFHLNQSQRNVYNLGLFNEVVLEPVIFQRELTLIVRVKERWYLLGNPYLRVEERNSYDLLGALLDQDFRRVAYGAQLQWRNLSGRNETLLLTGQLGFSQRLLLDFTRPALFRRANVDLRAAFQYINEPEIILGTVDGVVQWRGLENGSMRRAYVGLLSLRKRLSIYRHVYAEVSYRHYTFSDSLYDFRLDGEPVRFITESDGRERYPSLVVGYTADYRDYRAFPLSGHKYHLFGRLAGLSPGSSSRFAKLGLTWAHHLPLGERWNLAYGVHNVVTFGDSLPYFEKSFLGINRGEFAGLSSNLRGYEPYAIDGTFVNMNKVEVKYALFKRRNLHVEAIPFKKFQDFPLGVYLSAFCDTGYLSDGAFNNQDDFLKDRWLVGYGAGLNIIGIYDILLRIEYARNHLGQGGLYFHGSVSIK